MIIHTSNILALPLILLIWSIDMYLFLAFVYLVLPRLTKANWASRLCEGLMLFIKPSIKAVHNLCNRCSRKSVPDWFPWLIVFGGGAILKHLIVLLIVRVL